MEPNGPVVNPEEEQRLRASAKLDLFRRIAEGVSNGVTRDAILLGIAETLAQLEERAVPQLLEQLVTATRADERQSYAFGDCAVALDRLARAYEERTRQMANFTRDLCFALRESAGTIAAALGSRS